MSSSSATPTTTSRTPTRCCRSIRRALKPHGRLILIDFDRHEDASDFIKNHVRATKEEFFKEVENAGFKQLESRPDLDLEENFFASFQKVRRPSRGRPDQEESVQVPQARMRLDDITASRPPEQRAGRSRLAASRLWRRRPPPSSSSPA